MKKINVKSYLFQLVILVAVMLLFTECRHNAQAKKDFSTFVATFVFVIFMIIGGIPAIVFSAVSMKSPKSSLKVVAVVFVSIFGVCSLFGVPMYAAFWKDGAKEWVSILIFLQYGTLVLSIVLISIGSKNRAQLKMDKAIDEAVKPVQKPTNTSDDDEIDYLDEILND